MSWFDDPSVLLKNANQFWPKSDQPQSEQINAVTRFIIYGSLISYFLMSDKRIFLAAFFLIIALFLFTKVRHITPLATKENSFNPEDPFGNFDEYRKYDKDNVKKVMKKVFPEDTINAERPFYSVPNNDLDAYFDFVHGGRDKPFCRQDQNACSADDNPRFMERPHLRATTNVPVFF